MYYRDASIRGITFRVQRLIAMYRAFYIALVRPHTFLSHLDWHIALPCLHNIRWSTGSHPKAFALFQDGYETVAEPLYS